MNNAERIERKNRRRATSVGENWSSARAERQHGHNLPVTIHRYSQAREMACKAAGMALIEVYVGHKGSPQRSHEMAPKYNADASIERQIAFNDRLDRQRYRNFDMDAPSAVEAN